MSFVYTCIHMFIHVYTGLPRDHGTRKKKSDDDGISKLMYIYIYMYLCSYLWEALTVVTLVTCNCLV